MWRKKRQDGLKIENITMASYPLRRLTLPATNQTRQPLFEVDNKDYISVPHYWLFMKDIHLRPVNPIITGQWCRGCVYVVYCLWKCVANIQRVYYYERVCHYMVTSSDGNTIRVTGPLCGEITGHRLIPLTKASDAELWCFLWSSPEQTVG